MLPVTVRRCPSAEKAEVNYRPTQIRRLMDQEPAKDRVPGWLLIIIPGPKYTVAISIQSKQAIGRFARPEANHDRGERTAHQPRDRRCNRAWSVPGVPDGRLIAGAALGHATARAVFSNMREIPGKPQGSVFAPQFNSEYSDKYMKRTKARSKHEVDQGMPSPFGIGVACKKWSCYDKFLFRRSFMADAKDKIKEKIDDAARKAKDVAGKAVDKSKNAAKKVGKKVKDAGQKIKDRGS